MSGRAGDEGFNVAVVGATGLVGETMIEVLEERDFPVRKLFALASERSLGKSVTFRGQRHSVGDLAKFDFSEGVGFMPTTPCATSVFPFFGSCELTRICASQNSGNPRTVFLPNRRNRPFGRCQ